MYRTGLLNIYRKISIVGDIPTVVSQSIMHEGVPRTAPWKSVKVEKIAFLLAD